MSPLAASTAAADVCRHAAGAAAAAAAGSPKKRPPRPQLQPARGLAALLQQNCGRRPPAPIAPPWSHAPALLPRCPPAPASNRHPQLVHANTPGCLFAPARRCCHCCRCCCCCRCCDALLRKLPQMLTRLPAPQPTHALLPPARLQANMAAGTRRSPASHTPRVHVCPPQHTCTRTSSLTRIHTHTYAVTEGWLATHRVGHPARTAP
jgi:hypothetical protein